MNDIEDFYQDLKDWSLGSNSTILITKPSTYLKGANFAVYESIPEEKVTKKFIFGLLFVETQQIVDTILEFGAYETKPQNLKGDMLSRNSWKSESTKDGHFEYFIIQSLIFQYFNKTPEIPHDKYK